MSNPGTAYRVPCNKHDGDDDDAGSGDAYPYIEAGARGLAHRAALSTSSRLITMLHHIQSLVVVLFLKNAPSNFPRFISFLASDPAAQLCHLN